MQLKQSFALSLLVVFVVGGVHGDVEYLWEAGGEGFMNVVEQPFVQVENVMMNAQVYEYEARVPVNDAYEQSLKQLEEMIRDGHQFGRDEQQQQLQQQQEQQQHYQPHVQQYEQQQEQQQHYQPHVQQYEQQQEQQQQQQHHHQQQQESIVGQQQEHRQRHNHYEEEEERVIGEHDKLHGGSLVVYEFADTDGQLNRLDDSYVLVEFGQIVSQQQMKELLQYLAEFLMVPIESFKDLRINKNAALFRVDRRLCDPSHLVNMILKYQPRILQEKSMYVIGCDLAIRSNKVRILKALDMNDRDQLVSTPVMMVLIFAPIAFSVLLGAAICMVRRRRMQRLVEDEERLLKRIEPSEGGESTEGRKKRGFENIKNFRPSNWMKIIKQTRINGRGRDASPNDEYQDLCRQRMESNTAKCSPISSTMCSNLETPAMTGGINTSTINSTPIRITNETKNNNNDSERNSSWTEESTKSFSVDIKTGHVILDFLEKHLLDKNLLNQEWKQLCTYEADQEKCEAAEMPENRDKNRNQDIIPYDHSRVKLDNCQSDYINASYIIDNDPKNPSYITTQNPLADTIKDFWTMVWQKECTTIVTLCNSDEYDSGACVKFWPDSTHHSYGSFEIHLVSVHIWCEDYLIRNFLVKNTENNRTRAITQFHYRVWPTNGVPTPIKSILDFRRKVLKSHNNSMRPMIVHCSDGVARTGAYLLIDMVINKIVKGAKEIDLSATLEYLRDQRAQIVNKKYLYEYAFEAITEELKQLLE